MGAILCHCEENKIAKKAFLGIELGSTRIKALLIDESYGVIATGDVTWESNLVDGIWSYSLEDAEAGLRTAIERLISSLDMDVILESAGISGMMHGYLAFDENWDLLTPFRTWQNTTTREASEILTEALHFNIPQRWSVAHLFQAVLNHEQHVKQIAHITTLAGYLHFKLTGENVVCIDEASGMFPVDCERMCFDLPMLEKTQQLLELYGFSGELRSILPQVQVAGVRAGCLTADGFVFLREMLPLNTPFAPPAGDGGTGMVATNTISPKTGNVSAGTSIFADIVLDHPLRKLHPEIDIVATPTGSPVAEIHGNNCTNDMNLWVKLLKECLLLFGTSPTDNEIFTKLYQCSLSGDANCSDVVVVNYLAGEGITHLDEGRPLVLRTPNGKLNLPNFIRSNLYALFATLKLGIDILEKEENVKIDWLMGHGGVFKTPGVGQKYLSAACNTPVACMETASEGGPYGMAVLCAYMSQRKEGESLEAFLNKRVFSSTKTTVICPEKEDIEGFSAFMERFKQCLELENLALRLGL